MATCHTCTISKLYRMSASSASQLLTPFNLFFTHTCHCRFAIIDGCVLINGSFNWTRSAVLNNRENVVISSDPYLIQAFNHEFGSLWTAFRYNR
mmetsp:Transcript_5611/g.10204  ORF Transcript_5611/g.10204 Transcript_5611/m.10204 type:complete len:94 (-) Transcript_5611:1691-1972(-)